LKLLIFLAALFGLLVDGPRGLVVGAIVGYALGHLLRRSIGAGAGLIQSQFLETTFAVMGAVCKADEVVTRDEIAAAENVFRRLHLSAEQREVAKAAFSRGKSPGFDLDAEVDKLARLGYGRGPLLQLFLQVQCMAVAADGRLHAAEHEMLVRVARRLGLTERDVSALEALLRAASAEPSAGAAPSKSKLDDAYTALGLESDASVAEIKRAYRRLISENHPDKLAAKGLPQSMRDMAEERAREINVAYELIKQARQFV
jgi:DnaJ like chaperone protein